jgi:hypothetical protein
VVTDESCRLNLQIYRSASAYSWKGIKINIKGNIIYSKSEYSGTALIEIIINLLFPYNFIKMSTFSV